MIYAPPPPPPPPAMKVSKNKLELCNDEKNVCTDMRFRWYSLFITLTIQNRTKVTVNVLIFIDYGNVKCWTGTANSFHNISTGIPITVKLVTCVILRRG